MSSASDGLAGGGAGDPTDGADYASVLDMVSAYLESGTSEALLRADALTTATRLVTAAQSDSPDGMVPVEVARMVGLLRLTRYAAGADPTDYDAAMSIFQAIAAVAPELVPQQLIEALVASAPDDADRLAVDGARLLRDGQEDADPALLDRAVDTLGAAVRTTAAGDPDRPGRLSNLCVALRLRADRTGSASDIDRAVRTGAEAVDAATRDDPDRAGYLSAHADALHSRFEQHGDPTDLDHAIARFRQAVDAGATHPARALLHSGLGGALLNRFVLAGDPNDLVDAVARCRRAAALAPAGSPYFASCQANLGNVLAARTERLGSLADLDDAAAACRNAVDATPAGHPALAGRLSNLAALLQVRHVRHRNSQDLDAAVKAAADAVAAAGVDDPYRGMYLSNLAFMLRVRGELADRNSDLDAAVAAADLGVAVTPAGHPVRAGRLFNLGTALLSRWEAGGQLAELGQAVAVLERAVGAASHHDVHRATYRSHLAIALHRRAAADGAGTAGAVPETSAAEDALRHALMALAELPAGHPFRAGAGLNLGIIREARFTLSRQESEYLAAVRAYSDAADETSSPRDNRTAAARRWAELAARTRHWPAAATAYRTAVAMLPPLAWRGLGRFDGERLLAGHAGVPGDAAAACLGVEEARPAAGAGRLGRATQPGAAVAVLELGRGVLWGLLLETRGDLDRLRAVAPDLAARLAAVRDALESTPVPGTRNVTAWD